MTVKGGKSWNSGRRKDALRMVAIMKRVGATRHEIAEALNFSPSYVAELSAEAGRKKV